MTVCKSCEKPIEIGQTIVGFPVIRIMALNQSVMAGTEILFHLSCFLAHFKKSGVEIIKL
jgi:hypothetical protein